jgi:hypothetical protein
VAVEYVVKYLERVRDEFDLNAAKEDVFREVLGTIDLAELEGRARSVEDQLLDAIDVELKAKTEPTTPDENLDGLSAIESSLFPEWLLDRTYLKAGSEARVKYGDARWHHHLQREENQQRGIDRAISHKAVDDVRRDKLREAGLEGNPTMSTREGLTILRLRGVPF